MKTNERVEEMPTINCLVCGGDGFTVEHDPGDESGQTPMQVQCGACHAEGRYATLDVVRTILEAKDKWWNKHEQDMYEELESVHREEIEKAVREEGAKRFVDGMIASTQWLIENKHLKAGKELNAMMLQALTPTKTDKQ